MMIDSKILVITTILCAVLSSNAESKLFKWVDKEGTTHYGETIPPEYANSETMKLEKGRIEKREDKNLLKKAALKDPAAEKARIEAERHDNALVNTYSSEKEIDLSRERNMQQVEARTGSFTILLKSAQENEVQLQKEAAALTSQGRKIPKSLEEDLADAKVRIAKLQGDLDNSLKENAAVKARYEADKSRYRELKGIVPPKK
jgi:hypothetical protein